MSRIRTINAHPICAHKAWKKKLGSNISFFIAFGIVYIFMYDLAQAKYVT